MKKPLISVIVPIYNVEEYLIDCLESVVNQTYKNIELIAINDGSTDNSLQILEDYASKYMYIKVVSQENSGQSVARNVGISMASGKYVYFLDSDDYIKLNTFEDLITNMEEYDLDIIRFGAEPFVDRMDEEIDSNQYDFSKYFDSEKIYTNNELLAINTKTFWPSPVLYIIRKKLLTSNNITFKPGIIHEDVLFTTEVFLNCKKGMYKNNFYYKRRYRPNSVMTSVSLQSRIKSLKSRYVILNELINMLKRYTDKDEKKLIRKRVNTVLNALIYDYKDLDKVYREEIINQCKKDYPIHYIYCVLRKNIVSLLKRNY